MNEQQGIKPYVIGLDLGGTNSVFGIVDARGEIKATTAIKTGGFNSAEEYVKASVEALQPIIEQVGGIEKIKAMGIGAPNGNYYKGTIEKAPNLPWAHDTIVPLADLFSKQLNNIPVALTNDANAAAIGEMVYGVARGMKNFIVITWAPVSVLVLLSMASCFMDTTALLANWDMSPWYVAPRAAHADVAAPDVWKPIVLPQALLAQHVNYWQRPTVRPCSAR